MCTQYLNADTTYLIVPMFLKDIASERCVEANTKIGAQMIY